MNNLEQLTASRNTCQKLFTLGILPSAFLWWLPEENSKPEEPTFEVCPVLNPLPNPECLPAWTKAELDAMIGPAFSPKPDLFTKEQLGGYKLAKPESYPVYFVEKMQVFENGAEASGAALVYLMEGGHITAASANYRLQKVFRPFKK